MFIAKLTFEQRCQLEDAIARADKRDDYIAIAFDGEDLGFRWRVGREVWSPPVKSEIV